MGCVPCGCVPVSGPDGGASYQSDSVSKFAPMDYTVVQKGTVLQKGRTETVLRKDHSFTQQDVCTGDGSTPRCQLNQNNHNNKAPATNTIPTSTGNSPASSPAWVLVVDAHEIVGARGSPHFVASPCSPRPPTVNRILKRINTATGTRKEEAVVVVPGQSLQIWEDQLHRYELAKAKAQVQ